MSTAQTDLRAALSGLAEAAERLRLPGPQIGSGANRTAEFLMLNGLQVVAFVALEDYVRRRAYEVIAWLGSNSHYALKFEELPEHLQRFVLEGTIQGLGFWLAKTAADERINFFQYEGLLLGSISDGKSTFVPSEYFFGRSQSNLATHDVGNLLAALGVEGGLSSLGTIAEKAEMSHLGQPDQIFSRLSRARHKAAHGFPSDYKIAEFKTDLDSGLPLFAFVFDCCISQCAVALRDAIKEGKVDFSKQKDKDGAKIGSKDFSYSATEIALRVLEFDASEAVWKEYYDKYEVKKFAKGKQAERILQYESGTVGKKDSVLIKASTGGIDKWFQPTR